MMMIRADIDMVPPSLSTSSSIFILDMGREDNGQDIDTVWVPSGIYKRGEKVVGRVGRESFLYSTIDRSILGIS